MITVSKSARNIPIGELNNIFYEFGLEVDVVNEEIVLFDVGVCPHLNVVRLLDGRFVCLNCQDTRDKVFGVRVV
jgi:hypothetical protein